MRCRWLSINHPKLLFPTSQNKNKSSRIQVRIFGICNRTSSLCEIYFWSILCLFFLLSIFNWYLLLPNQKNIIYIHMSIWSLIKIKLNYIKIIRNAKNSYFACHMHSYSSTSSVYNKKSQILWFQRRWDHFPWTELNVKIFPLHQWCYLGTYPANDRYGYECNQNWCYLGWLRDFAWSL